VTQGTLFDVGPRPVPRRARPAVKRHGGKWYLARAIIPLLPPHATYVEPFAGGLSVLLNKERTGPEVASDLDEGLVHMYRTMAGDPDAFVRAARGLAYDAETFAAAEPWTRSADPMERALGVLVRGRYSRGGLGRDFAWSTRLRGGEPGDLHAWRTFVRGLPAVARRLAAVRFLCEPAGAVVRRLDGPGTLFYCDPPYAPETRTARKAYHHEMTEADHRALLSLLVTCGGSVVLSGYRCPLYDEALAGWARHDVEVPNHAGQTKVKGRRVECVWVKPDGA
jgi:DNA adenine methylase